jgi:hypothetical protein
VCVCARVCACVCVRLRVGGGDQTSDRTRCPAGSPWQAGQAIAPACHAAEATSHSDGNCGRQLGRETQQTHTNTYTDTDTDTLIRNCSRPLQPGALQQRPLQPGPRQPGKRFEHGYGCRVVWQHVKLAGAAAAETHPSGTAAAGAAAAGAAAAGATATGQ